MREALKSSKRPGNSRNLLMYVLNGKKDGMQLIRVSEVTAKDELFNIKNVARDDLLAARSVVQCDPKRPVEGTLTLWPIAKLQRLH
jgi:capsid portal protein